MQFLDPSIVIQHFDIQEGMHVAELHAGSGFFTPLLLEKVGPYGTVHSLQYDELQEHIDISEPVDRILAINLPTGSVQHLTFSKAFRILKPGGKIILIDVKNGVLSEGKTIHVGGLAGFVHQKNFYAGDHHFGVVFKKS